MKYLACLLFLAFSTCAESQTVPANQEIVFSLPRSSAFIQPVSFVPRLGAATFEVGAQNATDTSSSRIPQQASNLNPSAKPVEPPKADTRIHWRLNRLSGWIEVRS